MNKFLMLILIVSNINAMDQVAQKQQEKIQKAAKLSKKIYLGRWKTSKCDVVLNCGREVTLNVKDVDRVVLDEQVLLGEVEDKGYFLCFNVTKLKYPELTIILSLVTANSSYGFTTIAKCGRNQPHISRLDLNATEVTEGISIDGEIDGEDLAASKIFCRPRTSI